MFNGVGQNTPHPALLAKKPREVKKQVRETPRPFLCWTMVQFAPAKVGTPGGSGGGGGGVGAGAVGVVDGVVFCRNGFVTVWSPGKGRGSDFFSFPKQGVWVKARNQQKRQKPWQGKKNGTPEKSIAGGLRGRRGRFIPVELQGKPGGGLPGQTGDKRGTRVCQETAWGPRPQRPRGERQIPPLNAGNPPRLGPGNPSGAIKKRGEGRAGCRWRIDPEPKLNLPVRPRRCAPRKNRARKKKGGRIEASRFFGKNKDREGGK